MRFVMMLLAALGLFAVQPAWASLVLSGTAPSGALETGSLDLPGNIHVIIRTSIPTTAYGFASYLEDYYVISRTGEYLFGNEIDFGRRENSDMGTYHSLVFKQAASVTRPWGDGATRYEAYYFDKMWFGLDSGDGSAFDYVISIFDAAIVPEPATWAMLIVGFGAAAAMMRRRGIRQSRQPRPSMAR